MSAIADDFAYTNAESYEYLVAGWGNDATEEELDEYYSDAYGRWEYTTFEEYFDYIS